MTPDRFITYGAGCPAIPLQKAKGLPLLLPVDPLFELLADLEKGEPLGRNLDALPGLGVSTRIGVVFSHDEASEPPDFDPAVFAELIL
jgi:hypothetical protein